MRLPSPRLAVAAALFPLAVAACGGGGGGGAADSVPANPDLTVVAPGGLKFDQKAYTAKSGKVEMAFVNKDQMSHDAAVYATDASGNKTDKVGGVDKVIAGGRSAGATLDLKPGTYLIVCTVPGHEAAGMKATLTVS